LYSEAASPAGLAGEVVLAAPAALGVNDRNGEDLHLEHQGASGQADPVGEPSPSTAQDVTLVARVLPDVAGFERELDYEVPPVLAGDIRAGSIVRVPLQGRRVRGWVVAFPVPPTEGLSLRPIAKVTGWGPEPELLDLASWAAWRWAGRRRSLLVTASPETAVRGLPPATRRWPSAALTGTNGSAAGTVAATDLLDEAWRPGVNLLRLPPDSSATELVLAAAAHGAVLVVAPTTARAAAGRATLRKRGVDAALLPNDWAQARGGAPVVIGTRAAALGPCPAVSSIVVLDAHDEGLVQETAPTWDAPSLAAERARRAGVPCFWVSACPTLELVASADYLHLVSRAAERSGWAALHVVDRRPGDPRQGLYSAPLVELLRSDQRVVCVLNRKGRALLLTCGACGAPATCERCGSGIVLEGDELVCRRCGQVRPVVCASCGSDGLRQVRVGVSRAREQLEALAGRVVGEVVAGTRSLPHAPVLVGTETVLYREGELRRDGDVGVVAFLDFDQELLAPRYRAGEEALALIARASRVVGGRKQNGKVLVQTRAPAHPVIEAALRADPGWLLRSEEPVRKALRLPPFAALALISGPGAAELAGALEKQSATGAGETTSAAVWTGVELSELAEERWVVRAPDHATLADALAAAGRPAGRVRVEVDPVRV
jgi:primosomal protein N' (replication factor Y) (superfamily II helicase)